MSLFKNALLFTALFCLGCSAQSAAPELNQRIERQVRSTFNLPANVQVSVGERKASEFANYDLVAITLVQGERKQTHEFLLSKDGKTLIRFTKMDITTDPYAEAMKKIDVQGRPVRGSKDAKVTIVNYDDFQCPFCSRMHTTLTADILKSYGDRVRVIYKDFPLYEIHPWANRAAVDANCVAEQSSAAYWDFADYVHANPREIMGEKRPLEEQFAALDRIAMLQGQKHNVDVAKLQSCLKAQSDEKVRASVQEAAELGVQATPTIFINGQKIDGAIPGPELHAVIDRALRDAGQAAPAQAAANPGAGTAK